MTKGWSNDNRSNDVVKKKKMNVAGPGVAALVKWWSVILVKPCRDTGQMLVGDTGQTRGAALSDGEHGRHAVSWFDQCH